MKNIEKTLAKVRKTLAKYKLSMSLIATGILVPSALVVAQSLYSDWKAGTVVNCQVAGSCNIVVSPQVASELSSGELRFGATSGTQFSTLGSLTTASTTGSFLADDTLIFGVNAGTAATATSDGTTSTISFVGRTCFFTTSPTGTRYASVWVGGTPVPAGADCD